MRLVVVAMCVLLACGACRSDGKGSGPPVPASSDPEGNDLKVGAIVAAYEEPSKSYRLYKVKAINFFPMPVGDELVMIGFAETGNDFQHASDLWRKRDLTVALANIRVQRHMFTRRDYRVLEYEAVTDADKALEAKHKVPQRQ